ncbi:hypothetical protein EfmE980_1110 [Enterococcus faecium E980]|nr:hypothetical protein EfmE980_1110 [Enterococcus faecium E980]
MKKQNKSDCINIYYYNMNRNNVLRTIGYLQKKHKNTK